MAEQNVYATRTVAVPAERVFAVLADPSTHASIDGTGWVQAAVAPAPLTEVGQIFRMNMYHANHPGGDYRVVNQVVVLESPHVIGWTTGSESDDGEMELGGWIWRYDLLALGPDTTEITLSYDWSGVPPHIRARGIQFPPFGPEHLPNSLDHLAGLAASVPQA